MKYEITQKGASRDGKAFVVGDVIDIDGDDVPSSLISKGRIVSGHAEKVAVTNPAKGDEPSTQSSSPNLDQLRADYLSIVGKKPHHALGAAKLQAAIDEALAT